MMFRQFYLILEICKYFTARFPVVASRVRMRSGYYPGIFWENSSIVLSWLHVSIRDFITRHSLPVINGSSCLFHLLSFRCSQFYCQSIKCVWLRVSCKRWACPLNLLSATENQVGTIITPGREIGGIHASQPSRFPPIEAKKFLAGRRNAGSLKKVDSVYLRNEIWKDARKFLDKLTSTVLSVVAARSDVGQGLCCFCPKIVVEGMAMTLFICSGIFKRAYWGWFSFVAQLWRPVGLNISLSCGIRGGWSASPREVARMKGRSCLPGLGNLYFGLVVIFTR